ncbi:MAG: glycine cleavage system aminomethyltransferase GcvT [Bacteroidota bacterium]|nr:glycine cleavage system aminomethyltransferase GcvT [Bacteroidota bacterium]
MKHTALTKTHEALGARMVPFAGYLMPVEYSGIKDEHKNVREKLGVFDVSHMGEFEVKGTKAKAFVQRLTSNDVNSLYDGKVHYTCFPNDKGGIVDDLLVYRFKDDEYLLVVNAANIDKDWDWCVKQSEVEGLEIGKELINISDDISQLAIQGPYALKAMQKLTDENVIDMEFYTTKKIAFAGIDEVIFSTTGYTGAGGCEIYCANKDAKKLFDAVMDAGKEFGIKPIGLGARDTLRLEMNMCLYGNDINDETSPIEGALGWITKFSDGNDFIMRAHHEKIKADGPEKRLKGFVMKERGIPRQHYPVYNEAGEEIGEVTSGTMSPMMDAGIGMAYLKPGYWKSGTKILIGVRKKRLEAEIVKPPIFKNQIPEVK